MNTVEEIEHAIRSLSLGERARLAHSLPALVPELDGDGSWERIVRDASKRDALSAELDELDAELTRDAAKFPIMRAGDFKQAQ